MTRRNLEFNRSTERKKDVERKIQHPAPRAWITFIVFLLMAVSLGIFRQLGNVDEIWNYNFGSNMASGLVPYLDFNLLQTPLFAAIHGLALLLFGEQLLVTRMFGALLFAGICQVLYLAGARLGAKGILRWILPVTFLLLFKYNVFFEYSCLILFCLLCCLYIDMGEVMRIGDGQETTVHYERWYIQLAVGVLGGVAVMSKQTFGGFVALASWISVIWVSRMRRDSGKERLRLLFFRLLGSSIPCFLVLFYLLGTGSWDDFLEMSVFGISTFSSSLNFIEYVTENAEYAVHGAVCVFVLVYAVVYVIGMRRETIGRAGGLILLYGGLGCINLYPLCNTYHLNTCLIPFLLLLIPTAAWLMKWLVPRLAAIGVVAAASFYIFICYPADCLHNSVLLTDVPHFWGIFKDKDEVEEYRAVLSAVSGWLEEGREVYILDNRASFYLVPSDRYHKYMDMFLVGNLGLKTPEECLQDTKEKNEDAIYLVPEDMDDQYQYPQEAVEGFVEDYLEETDRVGEFICYETAAASEE